MIPRYGKLTLGTLLNSANYHAFPVRVIGQETGKVLLYEVTHYDKNHNFYGDLEITNLKIETYICGDYKDTVRTRIVCYAYEDYFYRRKNGEFFEDTKLLIGDEQIDLYFSKKDDVIREHLRLSTEANERLIEQLKNVAKAVQGLGIEQPSKCLFSEAVCGYPINDCYNCPMHEWSDYSFPMTKCEFK